MKEVSEKDIDIIRQKLIEEVNSLEFTNIAWDLTPYDCGTRVYRRWFIKIINKHFGKE